MSETNQRHFRGRKAVVSTQIGMEFAVSCPPIAKMMIVFVPPGLVLHVVPFFPHCRKGDTLFLYWFFCLFGGYVGMVGELDAWEITWGHVLSPLLVELGFWFGLRVSATCVISFTWCC